MNRKSVFLGLAVLAGVAMLIASGHAAAAARRVSPADKEQRPVRSIAPARAARVSPETQPEVAEVANMQGAFALDLYHRLATDAKGGNVFFSPYSVFAALAMTAEGARGETAGEMGHALHLPDSLRRHGDDAPARPWDFADVHAGLGALATGFERGAATGSPEARARIDSLRAKRAAADEDSRRAMESLDAAGVQRHEAEARRLGDELNALLANVDRYELRIANALWGEATYPFAPQFVRTIDTHYGSGAVRSVDFRHAAEAARQGINAWASDNTAQRIHDLLAPGAVDSMTRLVLTNAIYFKGEWAEVFDARATREEPFQNAGGAGARVPLMHKELEGARYGAFRADGSAFPTPREIMRGAPREADDANCYPGRGGFQVAELPYKGGDLSMVVLLPSSPDGLETFEQVLSAERLNSWIGQLEARRVNVLLPKFRLALGAELSRALRAMGMRRAFVDPMTGHGAEFGGMTASTDPNDALFVSAVVHKAFLDVNEKGTEAAAATAVTMNVTAELPSSVPFVPTFRADRPFLFLIRDVRTGAILFMGRFVMP